MAAYFLVACRSIVAIIRTWEIYRLITLHIDRINAPFHFFWSRLLFLINERAGH